MFFGGRQRPERNADRCRPSAIESPGFEPLYAVVPTTAAPSNVLATSESVTPTHLQSGAGGPPKTGIPFAKSGCSAHHEWN